MNQEHKHISRHAGTFGFFTFLSRILGLVRDSVLAFALGAGPAADAFYVAFRIPNLLRRLVAEGALTISFVPVFTSYLKKSDKEGNRVLSVVFTFLLIFLVVLSAIGILFAPKSGQETRNLIRDKAGEGQDYLKRRAEELRESAGEVIDRGRSAIERQRDRWTSAVEAGKQAYREAVGPKPESAPEPNA